MGESIYAQLYDPVDHTASHPPSSKPVSPLPTVENSLPPLLSSAELARWRWANVENLDLFLQDVYQYYLDKGFACILLRRAVNMAIILFVVIFTSYLGSCIDYSGLRTAKSLADVRISHCLAKSSTFHKIYLWAFGALWIFKFFQYASDTVRLYELKMFYRHLLGVSDTEIQTISWQQVVKHFDSLTQGNFAAAGREVPGSGGQSCKLDAHSIVNRIMRKENYTVALLSGPLLDFSVTLPILGDLQFFTKGLEWTMAICIDDFVFGSDGNLRPIFLKESKRQVLAEGLRRRFKFAAVVNIVFAPILLIYMTLYYFFRYFNEYHSNPSSLGTRRYTPHAEWKLRELNELYHMFTRRLGMSSLPAARYISQFPHAKTDIFLRLVTFVCGSFAAVLGMLSIWDPELLGMEITREGTVLFYLGVFGTLLAITRGMSSVDEAVIDPEEAMREVIEFTHYMPDSWDGRLHTETVKQDFCALYDLKVKIILREMLGIVLNPLVLWLNLSNDSETIIDFYRDSTIHVQDLGFVCAYAMFDGQAKKVKARADDLERYYTTSDGKMLKSYLNFMDIYGPKATGHYSKRRSAGSSSESPAALHPGSSSPAGSAGYCPNLEASVMDQYNRLQNLTTVAEEIDLIPDDESSDGASTKSQPQEEATSDDEQPVTTGVFGLLNHLSQVGSSRR